MHGYPVSRRENNTSIFKLAGILKAQATWSLAALAERVLCSHPREAVCEPVLPPADLFFATASERAQRLNPLGVWLGMKIKT